MRVAHFNKIVSTLCVAFTMGGFGAAAEAATLILGASTQAWYSTSGLHSANAFGGAGGPIFNTFVGAQYYSNTREELRSYVVFNTSTINEPITSATLRLRAMRYYSSEPAETVALWDVTTPLSDLLTGEDEPDYFSDLGSGINYNAGTPIVATPPPNDLDNIVLEFFEFELNDLALQDLNDAAGTSNRFAIGLSLASLDNTPYIFDTPGFLPTEGVSFSVGINDPIVVADLPGQLILETAPEPPPTAIPEPRTAKSLLALMLSGSAIKVWRMTTRC